MRTHHSNLRVFTCARAGVKLSVKRAAEPTGSFNIYFPIFMFEPLAAQKQVAVLTRCGRIVTRWS